MIIYENAELLLPNNKGGLGGKVFCYLYLVPVYIRGIPLLPKPNKFNL